MPSFRTLRFWIPVVFWMVFIFCMSMGIFSAENTSLIIEPLFKFFLPNISQQSLDTIHFVVRKCGHFSEYFILGWLLFRAFRGDAAENRSWRWAVAAAAVVVLYAIGDEFHQFFVASRTASPVDVAIDSVGGLTAQVFLGLKWRLQHR